MMESVKNYVRFVLLIFIGLIVLPEAVMPQNKLERISVTERGDELGYVIRYHLDQPVDSFKVAQTDNYKIQIILYAAFLDISEYIKPEKTVVKDINVVEVAGGKGFELTMYGDFSFEVTSYFDRNQRDLLISLQFTDDSPTIAAPLFPQLFESILQPDDFESTGHGRHLSVDSETNGTEPTSVTHSLQRIAKLDRHMPDDPFELYTRSMTAAGFTQSFMLRPSYTLDETVYALHPWSDHPFFRRNYTDSNHASIIFYSPKFFRSFNNEIPMGNNDGALWQGRGSNYQFSLGLGASYGPLTIVLRPQVVISENREFELSPRPRLEGLSRFAMPLMNSDIPERFGEDSISRLDFGDSFIELAYRGFAAGFSNQRMWTGPAIYNPLILSYHAPGFLHAYLGTQGPYEFRYGRLETKWFWGGLRESDFFDEDPNNNLRFVTGLAFAYSPQILPGLHLGFTRTAFSYYPKEGPGVMNALMAFRLSQPDSVDDPDESFHSMMSFFGRWVFPTAGFELYAEWGRNDNKRRIRDFIAEPELNRGYVLGFIKNFNIASNRILQINTEITNVENSSVTSQQRDFNTWYEHDVIRQGFTNRGKVLGASIGPGSSTQIMRLSYYERRGMLGLSAQRVAMHNDRFHRYKETYRSLHPWPEFWFMIDRHIIQMNYGFHALYFLPLGFEVQLDYHIAKFDNRHNLYNRDLTNNHFMTTLRYNLNSYINIR